MEDFVGRSVSKQFPGFGKKKFKGKVTSHDPKDKLAWHIMYEDGDEEDITHKELLEILVDEGNSRKRGRIAEKTPKFTGESKGKQPLQGRQSAAGGGGTKSEAEGQAGPRTRRGGKQQKVTSPSSDLTGQAIAGSEGLRELISDVAAKSKAHALNVVRYRVTGEGGTDEGAQPLMSQAVTCGSLCFLSTIYAQETRMVEGDPVPAEELAEEYTRQTEQVLSQLDAQLKNIGSDKRHLINVTVILREVDSGIPHFSAVWNKWVPSDMPPAMCATESFMDNEALVALTAMAAVPPQIF